MFTCLCLLLSLIPPAQAAKVTVPIEVGVGPNIFALPGPISALYPLHPAISLSAEAVITKKFIRKNKKKIPRQYRKQAMAMDELRISKLWIPDMIIISQFHDNFGIAGISFRPIGLRFPISTKPLRTDASLGLRFTAMYLNGGPGDGGGDMFFINPGLDGRLQATKKINKTWSVTLGGMGHVYPPQDVDDFFPHWTLDPNLIDLSHSVWLLTSGYLKVNHRFPFETRI